MALMGGGVVSSHKLFSASWERFIFFLFVLENAVPEGVCFSINLFAVFQYLLSAARNQFVLFKHNIECKITIFRFKSKAIFSLFCQYTNGLRETVSEKRSTFEILSWTRSIYVMLRKERLTSAKYEFTIANLNNATEKKKQKLVVMSRPLGNYWDLRIPRGVFVIAEKWFVQFTEWMMLVAKMSQIKTITMWCKEKHNWLFFLLYFVFSMEKLDIGFYPLLWHKNLLIFIFISTLSISKKNCSFEFCQSRE